MQPTSTYMFGVWGLELERNQTLQFFLTTTTANVAMIALGIFVLQSIKIKHFLELETWGFYIDHKACTMQNPESQGIFLLKLNFQVTILLKPELIGKVPPTTWVFCWETAFCVCIIYKLF